MFLAGVADSPAGPAEATAPIRLPPAVRLPAVIQTVRFSQRQIEFVFAARREHGEIFSMKAGVKGGAIVTSHPDHIRSLFTAKPEQITTLASESALRPILGPASVLTSNGPTHLRQRKLLLPPFHGEAIARYSEMIQEAAEAEIEQWPINQPFALAPRMQAITLQVIMSGIFGVTGQPAAGTPEHRLLETIRQLTAASTSPMAKLSEILNHGRAEPIGMIRRGVRLLDAGVYPAIRARRAAADLEERTDILSILLGARYDDGTGLTDSELRDELLTLLLAGFETTANSLSWAWERLVRTPGAHDRLRHAVRSGQQSEEIVEETITETMRCRPVVPIVGRRVTLPWQLGEYTVPAGSAISASILLVHHREDLYPEPFAFQPERWKDRKPGTYEWIPFGGGTRRCLGATLAMAEQRVVLATMARRLELDAEEAEPEHAQHRNVTMIPNRGARVVVRERLAA
jgi:cytochrome P450